MTGRTKYNRHTEHLRNYVDRALAMISVVRPRARLKSLKGYTLPKKRRMVAYGRCYKAIGSETHEITLYMGSTEDKHYITLEQQLTTLAHELAHMVYWHEHDHNHFLFMAKILESWSSIIDYTDTDTSEYVRKK